jgi:hypothetical protein
VHAQGIPDEDWVAEEYLKVAEYLKSKGLKIFLNSEKKRN